MKLLVSLAALFLGSIGAAEASDLLTDVRNQVADPSSPITLIVELPLPEGLSVEFKKVVQKVRQQEPRTLLYTALREAGAEEGVTVVETYADLEAFAAHLDQPHVKAFVAKLEAAGIEAKIRVLVELR